MEWVKLYIQDMQLNKKSDNNEDPRFDLFDFLCSTYCN